MQQLDGLARLAALGVRVEDELWVAADANQVANIGQRVFLLAGQQVVELLGLDELVVHLGLLGRGAAADVLHELGRQVLGVERVAALEDELVDNGGQLFLQRGGLGNRCGRGVWLSRGQNGPLVALLELGEAAEHARVAKVDHVEELLELVLHRRARQQHTLLGREQVERLGNARVGVFELVRLVADEQVAQRLARDHFGHLGGGEQRLIVALLVVRDDEHGLATVVDEVLDGLLGVLLDRVGDAAVPHPALDLVVPVADERDGASHNHLFDRRLALDEALVHQGPE